MAKKLSFEDSILTEESTSVKPHTYRAKVLRGINIVLKEDYNGKPIKKWECVNYEQARKLALKLMKQAPLPEPFEEGEKIARQCDVTKEGMNEGWVAGDGTDYFKYEEDAIAWCKKNGYKSLDKAYDDDAIYWTEWYDENCEDYQYIIKDGKVVEIEEEEEQEEDLKPEIKNVIEQHGAPNLTISDFPDELDITFKQNGNEIRIEKDKIKMICILLLTSIEH